MDCATCPMKVAAINEQTQNSPDLTLKSPSLVSSHNIVATRYLLFPFHPAPSPQKRKCCIPPKRKRASIAVLLQRDAQDLRRLQSPRHHHHHRHYQEQRYFPDSSTKLTFNKLRFPRAETSPSIYPSIHSLARAQSAFAVSRPSAAAAAFTGLFCRHAAISEEQGPSPSTPLTPSPLSLSVSLSFIVCNSPFTESSAAAAVFLVAKARIPSFCDSLPPSHSHCRKRPLLD